MNSADLHRILALAALILGAGAALSGWRTNPDPVRLAAEIESERDHISALDLADRIMRGDPELSVFDLRSEAEFEQFHILGARQISIETLAKLPLRGQGTIVLYSEGGAHAAQAWVLLRIRGFRNVLFLREGIYEWNSRVVEPRLATDATPEERAEFKRAEPLSRFFDGSPVANVSRAQVPVGYWTRGESHPSPTQTAAPIRRRGC